MEQPITLCLDFGNTRLKAAIFDGPAFRELRVLADDQPETLDMLLDEIRPTRAILSSVIHHNPALDDILQARTQFHRLSHLTRINFTTPVGKPETIGADRLALMAAAAHLFPNSNTLVIALGSCITYNFLNSRHEFLGGAISPGMEMRFKTMHEYTALLPLVEKDWNFPVIAYDTKTNLQSGVLAGMSFEIEGFIDYYQSRYEAFNVVLTGGDCLYFARRLKSRIFADPNFLYKGLYALSETNHA